MKENNTMLISHLNFRFLKYIELPVFGKMEEMKNDQSNCMPNVHLYILLKKEVRSFFFLNRKSEVLTPQ